MWHFLIILDAKDIDDAFLVGKRIVVDRSTRAKNLVMYLGKIPYATGQIDETYVLTHTGYMIFPDEKKRYSFWYYPVEGILKWTYEKGKGWAGDIWRAQSDETGNATTSINKFFHFYKLFTLILCFHIVKDVAPIKAKHTMCRIHAICSIFS